MIKRNAYAKINLSLDVLRRREDGYHEVRMIMQTVGICDELTFERIPEGGVEEKLQDLRGQASGDRLLGLDEQASGDELFNECGQTLGGDSQVVFRVLNAPCGADLGPTEKNLIVRAARLIIEKYSIKDAVYITLNKNIPVAAGMAGGSTDAAAVFHGLNELFGLNMTLKDMCEMGVKLGADIPYCIMGGTAISEGIGEILTPISAPPESVLLIAKPDINVSTKFVYENLHANDLREDQHPDVDSMIAAINAKDINKMAASLGNVLEIVTTSAYPIINDLKTIMKENGAFNSLMSGSGPTVFGIYSPEDKEKAIKCGEMIREKGLSKEVFVTSFV